MTTRTKIVCTIGPSVSSYEKILELLDAGMNVARLNFSHGTHEEHLQTIQYLKKARSERKQPLAIMLDTHGPKVRFGALPNGAIELSPGAMLTLGKGGVDVHPLEALSGAAVGSKLLFDDGYIISEVVENKKESIRVKILNQGTLKSGKGINAPGTNVSLPALTEQDVLDLEFGCKHDVDVVAASFIRSAEHVQTIKKQLADFGKPEILVISKIESTQGVENFDEILAASDGIMVARGDLGVEVDLAEVPRLQKMMIRKCYEACKPVVTATQMLESMIHNPRPTRAEVSDVANAIYDSTSCVMLSGETAVGKYPIETVRCMKSIVQEAESDFDYRHFFDHSSRKAFGDISTAVSLAAVQTAYNAHAKAILAFTASGQTARLVSRFRPSMPIIALTTSLKHYHQLAFNWGVIPVFTPTFPNAKEAFEAAAAFAIEHHILSTGDLVVATAGVPFGQKGSTNTMIVEHI